jgi:hypothetical protein
MSVERWDPFREVVSLRDAMNSLLQESFVRPGGASGGGGVGTLPLDIAETRTSSSSRRRCRAPGPRTCRSPSTATR